jgi:phosphinothricin acetyltransferase
MIPATTTIRLATRDDLGSINDIYNHFVDTSTCTYQETHETPEARAEWFDRHGPKHPVIVAELDAQVIGWGSLSPFQSRSAYRFSVENSVYVRHDLHGNGIGARLLATLIEEAQRHGHRTIIAGIDTEQTASIALHRKFGFEARAHLKQIGFKFGRWLDVVYMQRMV